MVCMSKLLPTMVSLVLLWPSGPATASWHQNAPAFSGQIRDFVTLRRIRPAPDYAFAGPDGETLTLGDFRGKVVLLNFWATWCPPCVEEMPSLDKLQGKLGGDRFEVLALSLDGSRDIVDRFFAEFGIDHLVVYMDKEKKAMQAFAVSGLPTSLVVGPDGNLLGGLAGPADWDSAEAEALMSYFIAKGEMSEPLPGLGSQEPKT